MTGSSTATLARMQRIPSSGMSIPLAGFGNVTSDEAWSLATVLKAAATTWRAPTLHVAGGAVLEVPGDRSVWARIDGDTDSLAGIAHAVRQSARRLGLYLDGRGFGASLPVATFAEAAEPAAMQALLDRLDGFRGTHWSVGHISLMRRSYATGMAEFVEFDRIPLPGSSR